MNTFRSVLPARYGQGEGVVTKKRGKRKGALNSTPPDGLVARSLWSPRDAVGKRVCGQNGGRAEPFQRGTRAARLLPSGWRSRLAERRSGSIWRGRANRPYRRAMARIAFLGLGVMGAPMARHLAAAGHASPSTTAARRKAAGLGRAAWRQPPRRARRRSGGGRDAVDRLRRQRRRRRGGRRRAAFGGDARRRAVHRSHHRLRPRSPAGSPEEGERAACSWSTRRSRAARRAPENGKLAIMCGGAERGAWPRPSR